MEKRSEIDNKYKWALSNFYSSEQIEADINIVSDLTNKLLKYKGIICKTSLNLLESLNLYMELDRIIENLYIYSNMSFDVEMNENKFQELKEKTEKIYNEIQIKIAFYDVELLKCKYSKIINFIKEDERLNQYSLYLERIFRHKKHTLSEKEEKILTSYFNIFSGFKNTFKYLTDLEMNFGKIKDEFNKSVKIDESNYSFYIKNKNRDVRKNAFNKILTQYKNYNNTFTSIYISCVKKNNITAKLRGYNSSLESSLFEDKIDKKLYLDLINVVSNNLYLLHEYIGLKKEILKVNEIHLYDMYASIDLYDKKYTYEEGKELIKKALAVLGEDYLKILNIAFDNNWIDVYPSVGKRSGAYSWGSYDIPPYILTNFKENLSSTSTLAHELGHSIHTYFSVKNQSYLYYNYPIFLAEIASTVNEILLSDYVIKNSNDINEKKVSILNILELFRATIFRQTMFAEFEMLVHDKEANNEVLTSEVVNKLYYNLNKKYFGKNIIVDKLIQYEWERVPHFYNSFYVYKYATGLSIAVVIADDLLTNNDGAKDRYIKFLSSGSSDYPINVLKKCGYNVNEETISNSMIIFERYLNELKELNKKEVNNE